MLYTISRYTLLVASLMFAHSVFSKEPALESDIVKDITTVVKARLPDVTIDKIEKTDIPSIYQIKSGVRVYYISEDLKHLFVGTVLDLTKDEDNWNVTENSLKSLRFKQLASLDDSTFIIYPAKEKQAYITVFTDIDCVYCRKLHREIGMLNDLGIEVKYLAFPRAGIGSSSYNKSVSVWCAKDKLAMMTRAKNGEKLDEPRCDKTDVVEHFN